MKRITLLLSILTILAIVISACSSSGAAVKCQTVEKSEQSQCYIDVGIETKDFSVCKQAEGRSENWCRFEVSKALDDVKGCESIKGDSYWSDICFKHFGETQANKDYCNIITNQKSGDECLTNVALDTGNPNVCKDIKDDKTQLQKCYYDSSIASINPLNCDRLENPINRDTCVSKIAKAKDDPELCKAIRLDELEQSCVRKFVVINNTNN